MSSHHIPVWRGFQRPAFPSLPPHPWTRHPEPSAIAPLILPMLTARGEGSAPLLLRDTDSPLRVPLTKIPKRLLNSIPADPRDSRVWTARTPDRIAFCV